MEHVEKKKLGKVVLAIMILAGIAHIYICNLLGIWFLPGPHDDGLLIEYSNLHEHFTNPNLWSMVKTMSYSIFMNIVHISGLSHSMVVSLVWIVAAILSMKAFQQFTQNRFMLLFVYLFVLFTPAAFDSQVGTRLYRNSIIAPFVFIVFAIFFIILFRIIKDKQIPIKKLTWIGIGLGLVFSFTYYIKEDGIWLLVCLLFITLVYMGIILFRFIRSKEATKSKKKLIQKLLALCIPLVIFFGVTNVYKLINYNCFGVFEIQTRTDGELGDFVNNVYKIESENRSEIVWAPADAIEKAFAASETLSQHPELLNEILHTPWFGYDIYTYPIRGDFLTWVLRDALYATNLWGSERQAAVLFAQVNKELNEAFADGTLVKDSRIQLVSSAGGRTFDEILGLTDDIIEQYKINILLWDFEEGGILLDDPQNQYVELASVMNNTVFTATYGEGTTWNFVANEKQTGNNHVKTIFSIYNILYPLVWLLAFIGTIAMAVIQIKAFWKTKSLTDCVPITIVLTVCILFGISLIYTLGIGWFCSFIWDGGAMDDIRLKYYSIGVVPLLAFIELFGTYLFAKWIKIIVEKVRGTKQITKL